MMASLIKYHFQKAATLILERILEPRSFSYGTFKSTIYLYSTRNFRKL